VLGDSYADSLYADALNRQRAAVIDTRPEALKQQWTLRDRPFKVDEKHPLALNRHVMRWDGWVRRYLAVSELIRQMDYVLIPPGETEDGRKQRPTLELTIGEPVSGTTLFRLERPDAKVFEKQLELVLQWAELREERTSEILTQIDNQTPFWGTLLPIQADRLEHTRELLDIAQEMAVFVEMRFKHELACWRPCDLSWMVQPMITTPGHGSLPAGHATQSYVVVAVLKALLDTVSDDDDARRSVNQQLERVAARIATNRVVAGLHFPVDNIAGRILGTVLGEYVVHRCRGRRPPREGREEPEYYRWGAGAFLGGRFDPEADFDPDAQPIHTAGHRPAYFDYTPLPVDTPAPVSLLHNLWAAAVDELRRLDMRFDA
jgi:membrane-associated phospholipid phosphatase